MRPGISGITTVRAKDPHLLVPFPRAPSHHFSVLWKEETKKEVCLAHKEVKVLHSWPDSANQLVPIRTEGWEE